MAAVDRSSPAGVTRLVVSTLLWLVAPAASAAAQESSACLLRGENVSLPIEVRPDDGPAFEVTFSSDVVVHFDSSGGPYPVDVARPLVFRGFADNARFPQLARDVKTAGGVITLRSGARIELVGAHDAMAAGEFSDRARLSVRIEIPCDALTLTARASPAPSPRDDGGEHKTWWPRHAVLHVATEPGRSPAVAIDIHGARDVPLTNKKQSGEFALVKGDLGDIVIEGWVPVRELASDDEARHGMSASKLVRDTPIVCHTARMPELHYAQIPAGTPIYPTPGRHPWARSATVLRIQIPDTTGAWVQPNDWSGRGWIARSAVMAEPPTSRSNPR